MISRECKTREQVPVPIHNNTDFQIEIRRRVRVFFTGLEVEIFPSTHAQNGKLVLLVADANFQIGVRVRLSVFLTEHAQ